MVRAEARTPEAILNALQTGSLYASSGVTFTGIRRDGDTITVESADAQEIQAIGRGGRLLQSVRAPNLTFVIGPKVDAYVRFTAFGHGSNMAWTQPFFVL
jgi:hypothetical protein